MKRCATKKILGLIGIKRPPMTSLKPVRKMSGRCQVAARRPLRSLALIVLSICCCRGQASRIHGKVWQLMIMKWASLVWDYGTRLKLSEIVCVKYLWAKILNSKNQALIWEYILRNFPFFCSLVKLLWAKLSDVFKVQIQHFGFSFISSLL